MAEKAHSPIGASSSHRWMNCPGSIRMGKGMPNEESVYAREGSCAHRVAELCLLEQKDAAYFIGAVLADFPEVDIDEEMCAAVQVYLDTVRNDYLDGAGEEMGFFGVNERKDLSIEVGFDLSHIYPGMYGTNDALIYDEDEKKLTVYDYKHGQGVPVEVDGNSQLLYYAIGALTGKHNRPISTVELVVVQPRCPHHKGPVRRWSCDTLDLLDFTADLIAAAELTEAPDSPLKAGEWCKFCPAAGICKELERHALEAARAEFTETGEVIVSDPENYSPEAVAKALSNAHALENWLKALRDFAHRQALAGVEIPGYKLVPSRPRRYWKSDEQAALELDCMGLEEEKIFVKKIKSPAQVETLFKGKKEKARIEHLWEKRSSGTSLVPLSDDRDPTRPAAEDEF